MVPAEIESGLREGEAGSAGRASPTPGGGSTVPHPGWSAARATVRPRLGCPVPRRQRAASSASRTGSARSSDSTGSRLGPVGPPGRARGGRTRPLAQALVIALQVGGDGLQSIDARIRVVNQEGTDLRLGFEISVMQPNAPRPHADLELADRLWVESILALLWVLLHLRSITELPLCCIWLPGRQAMPHAITDTPTQTRIHPRLHGEPSQPGAA